MFKIKCYSKAELAMLYFPDSEPKVAVNHLMRWIYKCKPLMDDLNKTCYSKQAKYLLAQQVRMVVEHLGEPWFEFWILNFEFWIIAAFAAIRNFSILNFDFAILILILNCNFDFFDFCAQLKETLA